MYLMSTPRAESIAKARNGDYLPITPPSESKDTNKIDHYAGLALVMREATSRILENDDLRATLHASRSAAELRRVYLDALLKQNSLVLESAAFAHIHAGLQSSQRQRITVDAMVWDRVSDGLDAGTYNFVDTAELVYEALTDRFDSVVAAAPGSARIIDTLAKLNITQFMAYRDTYLSGTGNWGRFAKHVTITEAGARFKPGRPLNATVTNALVMARGVGLISADDYDNGPTIRVADIPPDRVTVGCPVTFYNHQVEGLWTMYAEARHSIHQRSTLGSGALTADDTAASL